MLYSFIILYLLFTLVIGFIASKRVKNSNDYILAGRNLPAIMVGVTIFSTWFGSEMIMGVPAIFVKEGVKGLIMDCGGSILSLTIISIFFTKPIYKLKIYTVSDFFKLRYGKYMEIATSIIIVLSYFSWVASQFLALAFIFQSLFGFQMLTGILISAGVVLFYTYIGGMWAVSVTDLIQASIMAVGLLVIFWIFWSGNDFTFPKTHSGFWNLLPNSKQESFSDYLGRWAIFGIGAIVSQEIYQRMLAAKTSTHAKNGVFLGGILMLLIGVLPSLTGLLISVRFPELLQANDGQSLLVDAVRYNFGIGVQVMFFGALISAILSTASGAILAPATILSENLFFAGDKRYTDSTLLLVTRISTIIITLGAAFYAYFNQNIHSLVVDSVTLITVGMTAPFVLGLYWKKTSKTGAWCAFLGGILSWFIYLNYLSPESSLVFGIASASIFLILGSIFFPDNSYLSFKKDLIFHLHESEDIN